MTASNGRTDTTPGRLRPVNIAILLLAALCLSLAAPSLLTTIQLNLAYLSAIRHVRHVWPSDFLHGSSPSVIEARGRIAFIQGDDSGAIAAFSRAIDSGRARDVTRFQLGEALARLGQTDSALAQWRIARAAPYFLHRGLALRHQGRWEQAESALVTAVVIEPADANLLSVAGHFFWEWGKLDKAHTYLRDALSLEQRPYEQLLLRGEVAQLEGHFDEAQQVFGEGVRRQSPRPEAYWLLAGALDALGRHEAAVDALRAGLRDAAPDIGLQMRLAQRLTRQGDFAGADQLYQAAQRTDPRSDEPWLLRAQNAFAWDHPADTEYFLLRALQLEPNSSETLLWMAKVKAQHSP